MTLIELLVVITILGILIAVLVPKIGSTQAKTRDITRQTQVQELASALLSYKQDFGSFPIITGHITVEGTTGIAISYRGNILELSDTLKDGGYISKIFKDPANINLLHNENFYYNSNGYYIYVSDGKSFLIITPVEHEKNGNCRDNAGEIISKLRSISDYNTTFNDIDNNSDTGLLYIYKYEEEVL